MVLLTHNDLDGVGNAILLKLAVMNCEIVYCKSKKDVDEWLTNHIQDFKYVICNTYQIFITDLSCDESWLRDYPNLIRLFDHHISAKELDKYSNATVKIELNDKKTCGTELFYNWLVNHTWLKRTYPFFIEQIRLYDTYDFVNTGYNFAKYLSNLLYIIGINNFVHTYVKKLRKGDLTELTLFSKKHAILLEYDRRNIRNYINKKLKQTKIIYTDAYNIGIVYAESNQSELGHEICKTLDVDLAIMINMNERNVSIRTLNEDIHLPSLVMPLNGGGHAKAAGFPLPDENVKKHIETLLENMEMKNITFQEGKPI